MTVIDVYVGNFGTYEIPGALAAEAGRLSGNRWRQDRRTKGARLVKQWGLGRDKFEAQPEPLKKVMRQMKSDMEWAAMWGST